LKKEITTPLPKDIQKKKARTHFTIAPPKIDSKAAQQNGGDGPFVRARQIPKPFGG